MEGFPCMQYLLRPDQHSHDFTSTPRPLSLPRCLIPFSRHRDVRGGLTTLRHGGARKTRKRTHRTRKRFHEQEVFRISLQNPYNTISLIESKREFRKLIEERLGGRAQHGNTRGRRPDHSGWCPQGWIPQGTLSILVFCWPILVELSCVTELWCDSYVNTMQAHSAVYSCTRHRAHQSPLPYWPHPCAATVFLCGIVVPASACLENNVSQ